MWSLVLALVALVATYLGVQQASAYSRDGKSQNDAAQKALSDLSRLQESVRAEVSSLGNLVRDNTNKMQDAMIKSNERTQDRQNDLLVTLGQQVNKNLTAGGVDPEQARIATRDAVDTVRDNSIPQADSDPFDDFMQLFFSVTRGKSFSINELLDVFKSYDNSWVEMAIDRSLDIGIAQVIGDKLAFDK